MAAPADCAIHVVDPEETTRSSLEFLLRAVGYQVEHYATLDDLLKGEGKRRKGCILFDLAAQETSGRPAQRLLHDGGIDLPLVVTYGGGGTASAVSALKSGAVDCLEKPFRRSTLVAAIDAAIAIQQDGARSDAEQEEASQLIALLTRRERDVLRGLACGRSNKMIAHDLAISPRTVEIHRARMMRRLKAHSLPHALRMAFAAGLDGEPEAPPPAIRAAT